jgi:hypothetical protein
MNNDEGVLCRIDAAPLNRADEDPRDASARNWDSAMSERKQRDEGQKRDEPGRSQKDPAAAVGLEADLAADLVDRDGHCRSARVGNGGSVKLG